MPADSQTLSQRLAAGGMPMPEALHYAVELSEALRHIHSEGKCHGALTPDAILLTASGLQLLPPEPGAAEALTPFTAPEQIRGHAPDACTDMFAFGAVVYEMLTGRRPFSGDTSESLADSISNNVPPPIGQADLDRLISTCLSKDRAGRWHRMQQVVMELKLLSATARRGKTGAVPAHSRIETSLRAEIEQIEVALAARLEQHEKAVAEQFRAVTEEQSRRQEASLHAITEALNAVRVHVAGLDGHFATAQAQAVRAEQAAEAACSEVSTLQKAVHGEIQGLKEALKVQSQAIESARSATARTDDLVERVVEALEALQSIVLEQSEERAAK